MSAELVAKFRKHLKDSGKSNSTVIAYTKDLEQLLEHSEQQLHKLTHSDISETIKQLQEKHGFTAKTISRKINSFRTFYKFLLNQGLIDKNPAEKVDHPKVESKPARILSQLEYLALREVSRDNDRLHAMIELMLQTGIRIGELARLKLKHVNLNKNRGSLHIEGYSTIPERTIQLTQKAQQTLQNYIEIMDVDNEEHPLFPTRDGNHIIVRNIRSSIDRAMAKAGIEDACVNDLRNTFIVTQLKAGVNIDLIAEVVGHRSKSTTSKYTEHLEESYTPRNENRLVDV